MGSRVEYVNISGLRIDGRRPKELRKITCQLGVHPSADGSAVVELGLTKVLATVSGPREALRRHETQHDQAIINCHYSIAPFAGSDRRKRRAGDRKLHEAATSIKQCFESIILTRLYPRSEIEIRVLVIQSDGSALPAAVNAVTLALIDAGIGMKDFLAAASVLHIQRHTLLDPTYTESSSGGAELTVAVHARSGDVNMCLMDSKLPLDSLQPVLEAASTGAQHVYQVLKAAVVEHAAAGLKASAATGR